MGRSGAKVDGPWRLDIVIGRVVGVSLVDEDRQFFE